MRGLPAVTATLLLLSAGAAQDGLYGPRAWERLEHPYTPAPPAVATLNELRDQPLLIVRSSLSPGVLVRARRATIRFFSGLAAAGAEAPSFFAVQTAAGVKVVDRGGEMPGEAVAASWIVVSFAGCKGFERLDVPWLLSLEKRPERVRLTSDGLVLTFPGEDTGWIAQMPLYGLYKCPQPDFDLANQHDLPTRGIHPWEWRRAFPAEVVERCDRWSSILKAYPVGYRESFRVDLATDAITFRNEYRWLTIRDAWDTPARRFAALPPTLGLALTEPGFPVTFSAPIEDPDYPTAYGPYVGAFDVDRLDYTMQVLQYVNEMETVAAPADPEPVAATALERLRGAMIAKFPHGWEWRYDHGSRENYCWNIVADMWYCRALPLVPEPLRERARQSLRIYLENDVLHDRPPYRKFRGKLLLHGPGIGSWGGYDDAGKFSSNLIQTLWAYGHFTGDWALLEQRRSLIKRSFCTPAEMDWVGSGRHSIAELGDIAPPCSAYARIAWRLGDLDGYLLGCYTYAKNLVNQYVMSVGGRYFYELQPYHYFEPMPPDILPTNLWGGTAGWQVDSPTWGHGEHQTRNRWVRFQDPDTGRFYRDHLRAWVERELADPNYGAKRFAKHLDRDDAHILPSLVRVRSLTLDAPLAELRSIGEPGQFRSGGSGLIAAMYSYLRMSQPRRYARLVPRGEPSPWVLGLCEFAGNLQTPAQTIGSGPRPDISWFLHQTGDRSRGRLSFGRIDAFEGESLGGGSVQARRLSALTEVRWVPPAR